MRVKRNKKSRSWMACLVLASASLATSGCASLYHLTHYNAINEAITEHKRPYYHSGHTGRIIPKEHGEYCTTEPACFGYQPTCWQNWPTDCPNCPPPDRILSEEVLNARPTPNEARTPEEVPEQQADDPIERILDEPLPEAGDEDPIIPQGSLQRIEPLDVVRVDVETPVAPEPVAIEMTTDATTQHPNLAISKQESVTPLVADDSLLNVAEPSAVEIWESQVARRPVGQQMQMVESGVAPQAVAPALDDQVADRQLPDVQVSDDQAIAFVGSVKAAPNVEVDLPVILPATQPAAELQAARKSATVEVSSRRTIQFTDTQAEGAEVEMPRMTAGKSQSQTPAAVVTSSRRKQSRPVQSESSVPTFKITPAKATGRPVVGRTEPAGAPNRMIRFVSSESEKQTPRVDTADRSSGSSLKFR